MHNSLKENKQEIILFFPDPKLEGLTWHRTPFSVLAVSSLLVNKRFRARIRNIAFFYFQVAYPSKYILQKINRVIKYNLTIKPIFKIIQLLARIRLSLNFFSIPFEYFIYNFLKGKWIRFV